MHRSIPCRLTSKSVSTQRTQTTTENLLPKFFPYSTAFGALFPLLQSLDALPQGLTASFINPAVTLTSSSNSSTPVLLQHLQCPSPRSGGTPACQKQNLLGCRAGLDSCPQVDLLLSTACSLFWGKNIGKRNNKSIPFT